MAHEDAMARERRYLAAEERVRNSLESPTMEQALEQLARCPRRTGIPPLSSYYCECPVCDPDVWGLGNE